MRLERYLHRLKSDKVKLDEENSKLRTSFKGNYYFSITICVIYVSGRESE